MRTLMIIAMLTSLSFGCKKDDDNQEDNPSAQQPTASSYVPLEVGNYWVYRHYKVDSNGVETAQATTDSMVVSKDTMIGGRKYMVLEGTNRPYTNQSWQIIRMIRDSSGYIVNQHGRIYFSIDNFTDVLFSYSEDFGNMGKVAYTSESRMVKHPAMITVPAGTFDVLNFRETIDISEEYRTAENPRYLDTYYGKGVGVVLQNYFYLSDAKNIVEKRLIRYHVN